MSTFSGLLVTILVHGVLLSYMTRVECIIGGKLSEQDWPWIVSFGRRIGDTWHHRCGGAIISPRWILTAAHCMFEDVDDQIDDFTIISGTIDLNHFISTSAETKIKDIIVHENYEKPPSYDNDIALIELIEDLVFSDEVGPVTLAHDTPPVNTMCVSAGWGNTQTDDDQHLLKEVEVPIIDFDLCSELNINSLTSNMICAGSFEGGKDACQGDSGGPLVCKVDDDYVQAGITSWGEGCGVDASAGVYSQVSVLIEWINQKSGLSL